MSALHAHPRWAVVIMALVTLQAVAVSARSVQGFHASGRQWPGASNRKALAEALSLIKADLESDAVVAARWPDTVFLHTSRQSVPLTEDDAILLRQFDRAERLRLWIGTVPARPFYLLVRGESEDPQLEDRRQAEALRRTDGMELVPRLATSDGRYEVVRVIRR